MESRKLSLSDLQVSWPCDPAPSPAQTITKSKTTYIPKVCFYTEQKCWTCLIQGVLNGFIYLKCDLHVENQKAGILTVTSWQPKKRSGSPGYRWFSCRVRILTWRTTTTRWGDINPVSAFTVNNWTFAPFFCFRGKKMIFTAHVLKLCCRSTIAG